MIPVGSRVFLPRLDVVGIVTGTQARNGRLVLYRVTLPPDQVVELEQCSGLDLQRDKYGRTVVRVEPAEAIPYVGKERPAAEVPCDTEVRA